MSLNVTILDMQPIDPPTGGGRLRLLGLYHELGRETEARYVGTYDWRGPRFRRQQLSPTLEELLVPLSDAHFAAAKALSKAAGGRVVIDSSFHELASLSPDFTAAVRNAAAAGDVVVFSHPWIYPLVRDVLDPSRQLIAYDAHNVEGLLRVELLDDGDEGTRIARAVVALEFELCHAAHLILACSHEDGAAFCRLYDAPAERIRVIPNGTFTRQLAPATEDEKRAARHIFRLGSAPAALFIGSNYGPNVDAARFIATVLAPALPEVIFAVAGGVGDCLDGLPLPMNLRRTGLLSEAEKHDWLHASDLAINPMSGGSGTNIKMFDFMAAGLPIVSTQIGARGIDMNLEGIAIADHHAFADVIKSVLANPAQAAAMGRAVRQKVEHSFSWERISADLGLLLTRYHACVARPKPFFSVVVPTYERPALLTRLVERLCEQTWDDFEIVVVDQSAQPWPERDHAFGRDLLYLHTDLRGAALARNKGANLARGHVLAFIDDDCEPSVGWLAAAQAEFAGRNIVGLEGLITSNCENSTEWRSVTNDGFEGVGFMTANLFVRTDVFHLVNGFDLAFDNPHFREDTDLGWRIQEVGAIPFSREAWVYHPPHSRSIERESLSTRSQFFENDALLLRKHPKKYIALMRRERQWTHNPHFWPHFVRGLERHRVTPPREIRALIPDDLLDR